MKIEHLNATFQPAKIGHPHGLQVTHLKDNSTRNIFVYHEDGKVGARRVVGPDHHCPSRVCWPRTTGRGCSGSRLGPVGEGTQEPRPRAWRGGPPGRPPGLASVGHSSVVSVCLAALWAVRTAVF